jgi:trehalose synthase
MPAGLAGILSVLIFILCSTGIFTEAYAAKEVKNEGQYIRWLEEQSMLYNSERLAEQVSGKGGQWRHRYAEPQTEELVNTASVWFTAYPSATITAQGRSIIQGLSNKDLWETFSEMGIQAMHTGPLKKAGGIEGYEYTPTVDGWFDRIELTIDPIFGTDIQYKELVRTAEKAGAVIVGDIIPGHTGKGADFLLAERAYKDYPGLYTMVEIKKEDWQLLPEVAEGKDSENLSSDKVTVLAEKGYIPGHLQRVLFSVPGKTGLTGWNATREIKGADGKTRRWVYLHYFRPGQPTLNWLDPTFAANRLIAGDIMKTRLVFGAKVIRLDANPFLGIERKPGSVKTWSESHPLAVVATDNIAFLMRKLGGWSFQELNMGLEDMKQFMRYGPELSYDFITRPAYNHALLTGDASFLKLMLDLMHKNDIEPVKLIHAMQNHDEITYELVHFSEHAEDTYTVGGKEYTGKEYREKIISEMHSLAIGEKAPYNKLSGNGLCTTYAGFCAAAFGIEDPYDMSAEEKENVKKGHLLMAVYNAMQPGVFAISGWDLVGALPLKTGRIDKLVADGDYRWVNRGAYDLMGVAPKSESSAGDMPRAVSLYGSLPEQLKDPDSFSSKIKALLQMRKEYDIALARRIEIPEVTNNGLVVMVHELPDGKGTQMTLLNFGREKIQETVKFNKVKAGRFKNAMDTDEVYEVSEKGEMPVRLEGLESRILISE